MNFETRHILRWGIPGWYLIVNIAISVGSLKGFEVLLNNQFVFQSILVMLLGVPLGFIIYQPYFFLSNLISKDKTVKWNLLLLNQKEDERKFLNQRYAYMLTVIHGYGALISSILISLLFIAYLVCFKQISIDMFCWQIIINLLLLIVNITNYTHSQSNFSIFVNEVFKEKKTPTN